MQKAKVITGDQFCEQEKISHIDYLKIDAEGFDYEVLVGFKGMLSSGKVRALQFEHEGGRYIRDFHDFLFPLGYRIGKIYALIPRRWKIFSGQTIWPCGKIWFPSRMF